MESNESESTKSLALLDELMMRGKNYREEQEFDVFGGTVTMVFKPIPDEDYLPLVGVMAEKFGMDEDEAREEIEGALEAADGDAAQMDMAGFDAEFVSLMGDICLLAIDYDAMDGSAETLHKIIRGNAEEMPAVGGYTLEWGMHAMDLTGNLADAEKFRN